ncbi:MAG: hypothetical protein HY644_13170 [Acidobacteria bacterium]|nr:hypothetical protein [Acidobacteriota bacterium]
MKNQKMDALGRVVGGIVHDFNNVLTAIDGYCQIALHQVAADDPLCSSLEEIKKAGVRASTLTRQLLAFSRMQELQPVLLDLNVIIATMENLLRHLISRWSWWRCSIRGLGASRPMQARSNR